MKVNTIASFLIRNNFLVIARDVLLVLSKSLRLSTTREEGATTTVSDADAAAFRVDSKEEPKSQPSLNNENIA